mgnify:CR=1 FL=1
MRGEVDVRFPPKAYAASVVDQLRYLEMRRLGLYTEGALAGAAFRAVVMRPFLLAVHLQPLLARAHPLERGEKIGLALG